MYHSITFGVVTPSGEITYNTWDTWHLIPTQRPVIDPPELDYANFIGSFMAPIDLNKDVNRRGAPANRKASITFYAWHDVVHETPNPNPIDDGFYYHQPSIYSDIMAKLHGRIAGIRLEDDPEYYYRGIVEVSKWDPGEHFSQITFDITAEPFKYTWPKTIQFTDKTSHSAEVDTQFITPSIVTVTPNSATLTRLVLSNFAFDYRSGEPRDIILTNLKRGAPTIINGETKTITENGVNKFSESDFWTFPSVKGGPQVFNLSSGSVSIKIVYTPRYL